MTHSNSVKHNYSIFLSFFPIISIYASGISKFTLGDLSLMLVIVLYFIWLRQKKYVVNISNLYVLLAFYAFVVLSFLLSTLFFPDGKEITSKVLRLMRFSMYICIVVISKDWLDLKVFLVWMRRICIFATVFIVFQYIIYYLFGIPLGGHLPFLNLALDGYDAQARIALYQRMFRPSSIFLEPSHYAQYVLLYLVALLWKRTHTKNEIICAIFLSIGIVLSTSAQGVLIGAGLWIVFAIFNVKNKLAAFSSLTIIILLFVISYATLPVVQMTLGRIGGSNGAYAARVGTFSATETMHGLAKLIGFGYGSAPENVGLVGGAYIIYGCGYLGFAFAIYLFIYYILKVKNRTSQGACCVFFVMFFGTALFYTYMFAFAFSIIVNPMQDKIFPKERTENEKNSLFAG